LGSCGVELGISVVAADTIQEDRLQNRSLHVVFGQPLLRGRGVDREGAYGIEMAFLHARVSCSLVGRSTDTVGELNVSEALAVYIGDTALEEHVGSVNGLHGTLHWGSEGGIGVQALDRG
jgi:hypothetical protein